MTPISNTPRRERIAGLDAARALATAAMVVGHTADALLSDATRELGWVRGYWTFRGLTAPLFLFVSGWAVTTSIRRSTKTGVALWKGRLGRVLLLLGFGVLLRWPGWGIHGLFDIEPDALRQLVGFDALHCIALSLFAAASLYALASSDRVRAALSLAVVISLPVLTGPIAAHLSAQAPLWLRSMLVADAHSPFPLLPWMAYFFSGALAGQLMTMIPRRGPITLALLGMGSALILIAGRIGGGSSDLTVMLFASRLGQVLLIASAMMALPKTPALKLAPLGRSSLTTYVFHLPIVYGWSRFAGLAGHLGHRLAVGHVLAIAVVLLALGLGLSEGIDRVRAAWRAARRDRTPVAQVG